jgi:hypothetical protein
MKTIFFIPNHETPLFTQFQSRRLTDPYFAKFRYFELVTKLKLTRIIKSAGLEKPTRQLHIKSSKDIICL